MDEESKMQGQIDDVTPAAVCVCYTHVCKLQEKTEGITADRYMVIESTITCFSHLYYF